MRFPQAVGASQPPRGNQCGSSSVGRAQPCQVEVASSRLVSRSNSDPQVFMPADIEKGRKALFHFCPSPRHWPPFGAKPRIQKQRLEFPGEHAMTVISLSTDVMPPSERAESWRDFISRTIHNVSVERISAKDFSARISARQHDGIRCASFWTKAHDVVASVRRWAMPAPPAISSVGRWKARRRSPTTNSAGSWFVRGCHHHRQPPPDESLLSWKRAQNRRQPAGGRGRKVTARLAARPQHAPCAR